MKTITEYKVVTEYSADNLNSEATKLILSGWQPFGSLYSRSVQTPNYYGAGYDQVDMYIQPFVKYAAEN